MTYKDAISEAMAEMATDPYVRFIGYNVRYGPKANGTLSKVPLDRLIETPVAENLMSSLAIGLNLQGFKPVVYFERFDFILNAMDAIVNHLDKIGRTSEGEFKVKVIIRATVGNLRTPFFGGPTHTQDFSEALRKIVSFPVIQLNLDSDISGTFQRALRSPQSSIIVDYRDLYGQTIHDTPAAH
jgi:pyruvate dehydrogenase E1 component beta subunit